MCSKRHRYTMHVTISGTFERVLSENHAFYTSILLLLEIDCSSSLTRFYSLFIRFYLSDFQRDKSFHLFIQRQRLAYTERHSCTAGERARLDHPKRDN